MKIEIQEKIAMLAISSLNPISSLILKALSDDSISAEEHSLILLEFETFTRMKEYLREKSNIGLYKTGNIETEANELLRRNKIGVSTWVYVQNRVQNQVQNHVQNHAGNHIRNHVQNHARKHVRNHVQNHVQNYVQNHVQNRVQNHVRNHVQNRVKKIKM